MMALINLRIFRRHYLLAFIALILWNLLGTAHSASNITCSANMNNGSVNLGAITRDNADNARITATLSYSCTNTGNTAGYASVCLAANGGDHDTDDILPRYMITANGKKELAFNMMLPDGRVWGYRGEDGKEYRSDTIYISPGQTTAHQVLITVSMVSGEDNYEAPPGLHTNNFNNNNAALILDTGADPSVDCSRKGLNSGGFPFVVQATVTSSCFISATSDISLGNHPAGTVNITGSNNAINVACPIGMRYNIGLSPSNGHTDGTGTMIGTGGNPDKISYQLHSQSINGPHWGNTATANSVGNGVAGVGSGVPNSHTVYVTVPKTDVRPDTYSDVVTVTVYY